MNLPPSSKASVNHSEHDTSDHAAIDMLFDDLAEANRTTRERDTPLNRRNYVRNVYAAAEAFTNWLKKLCLSVNAQKQVATWTDADLAMLREETYYVDERGRAKALSKFVPTDTNLRFVIQLLQHLPRNSYRIDWDSDAWKAFRTGLKIRHRLTHPKRKEELAVTDEDLETARIAHKLIMDLFFQPVYDAIRERDARPAEEQSTRV